jgi:hypothetical protein
MSSHRNKIAENEVHGSPSNFHTGFQVITWTHPVLDIVPGNRVGDVNVALFANFVESKGVVHPLLDTVVDLRLEIVAGDSNADFHGEEKAE